MESNLSKYIFVQDLLKTLKTQASGNTWFQTVSSLELCIPIKPLLRTLFTFNLEFFVIEIQRHLEKKLIEFPLIIAKKDYQDLFLENNGNNSKGQTIWRDFLSLNENYQK